MSQITSGQPCELLILMGISDGDVEWGGRARPQAQVVGKGAVVGFSLASKACSAVFLINSSDE